MKTQNATQPPWPHPNLELTSVANKLLGFYPNELFKFSPKPLCFSYGYKRRPKSFKFSRSDKLLTAKLHPIQMGSIVPQNVGG